MKSPHISWSYSDTKTGSPVLVLLHAFPLDHEQWIPQVLALRESMRVITVDLPGFGNSPVDEFTVDSAADLVADILDSLSVKLAIVGGLSMGGYVALAMARRHPERLAGLILADTRAEADDAAARQNRDRMLTVVQEHGTAGVVEAMLPKLMSDETRTHRPQVVDTVRTMALRQHPGTVRNAIIALRDRPDATAELARIAVPTLVVVGEQDMLTPPDLAKGIAERIPDAQLAIIPGAGHLSNIEQPEAFNAVVREFVANRCPPESRS